VQPLPAARDEYVEKRIAAQADYYDGRATGAARALFWIRWAANGCTVVAILLGVLLARHLIKEEAAAHHYVKLAALTLPLIATTLLARVTAYDMERRAARYRQIANMLGQAKIRLEARATWKGVAEVVIEVERALLLETWEWYSVARYSSSH
jgi:hypothetical protein